MPALHAAARELAGELGVDHLELRNRIAREPGWPRQDLYVTFRKEILPEVEANLLAIPRKQRAMVRKGIQRGLRSELDASVDRFFALYADNVHRHGTPAQSKRYFETLQRVFGKDVRGAHRRSRPTASRCRASSPSTSATRCCPTTPAMPRRRASSRRTTSSTGS